MNIGNVAPGLRAAVDAQRQGEEEKDPFCPDEVTEDMLKVAKENNSMLKTYLEAHGQEYFVKRVVKGVSEELADSRPGKAATDEERDKFEYRFLSNQNYALTEEWLKSRGSMGGMRLRFKLDLMFYVAAAAALYWAYWLDYESVQEDFKKALRRALGGNLPPNVIDQ